MKEQQFIFIILFCISLALISCNQSRTQKIAKLTLQNKDSCSCTADILSPPPPPNSIISTSMISYIIKNTHRQFITKLIADKTIDLEGNPIQVFSIKADNGFSNESFDFALPTTYNKFWNKIEIYRDTQQYIFNIGFKDLDSNFIRLLYSISLDTLHFNKGLILINSKMQKIKIK